MLKTQPESRLELKETLWLLVKNKTTS